MGPPRNHGQGDEGSCRTSRASREAHEGEGDEGQGHEGQGHEGQEGRQEEVRCRAVCVPVTRAAMASLAIFLYNSRHFKEALKASSRVPCGLGVPGCALWFRRLKKTK